MKNLLTIILLGAPLMYATTNSCPNATASGNVSNGSNTQPTAYAGVSGGGNDFASLGSGGCTAVDLTFNNFGFSITPPSTGQNGPETAAGTYVAETPAGTIDNPLINPDDLLFSTVNGNLSGADNNPNDGVNNWVANLNHPITDFLSFAVSNSGNNPSAVVSDVLLTVQNGHLGAGATGTITVDVCEGISNGLQITDAGTCTTDGGTHFITQTLTLGTGSLDVGLGFDPSQFNITTVISLSTTAGGRAGFDAFDLQFDESPEPSTFVLLGSALAAIGLLRVRANRKAAVRVTE